MKDKILEYVLAFAIIIFTLINSIDIALYADMNYYSKQLEKLEVKNNLDVSKEVYEEAIIRVMNYISGDTDDLVIDVTEERLNVSFFDTAEFFNDKEKSHLEDIKNIFFYMDFVYLIMVIIITSILIYFINNKVDFVKSVLKINAIMNIVIVALIFLLIQLNFRESFRLLHEILFDNNNWLLNPYTDRLIVIMPRQLFINISLRILEVYSIITMLIYVIYFALKRINNKNKQ